MLLLCTQAHGRLPIFHACMCSQNSTCFGFAVGGHGTYKQHLKPTFRLTNSHVALQQYWAKADQAHSYMTCQEMAAVFAKTGMGERSHAHLQKPFQETDQSNTVRPEPTALACGRLHRVTSLTFELRSRGDE